MHKVLLVEDHAIVRLGLKVLVQAQPGLLVVGEVSGFDEALSSCATVPPDLVIMPIGLEGSFRGVELCRELKSLHPRTLVLIYTSFTAPEDSSAAYLSGADSFVNKAEDPQQLVEAIRATLAGRRVWRVSAESERAEGLDARADAAGLTAREREVLGLMLKRFTNARIAEELVLGMPTVKTHVRNILGKLGLRSRRELFGH